jgi:hypothetical protein
MLQIIPVMLCVGGLVTGICLVLALDSVAYGYSLIGVTVIAAISYIIIQRWHARQAAKQELRKITTNVLQDISITS